MGSLCWVGGGKPLAELLSCAQRVGGASRPWRREPFLRELRGASVKWKGEVGGGGKQRYGPQRSIWELGNWKTKGTSLVVQWWRIHLVKQGTWVQSLAGELGSHMPRGSWAHTPTTSEPAISGAHGPQLERSLGTATKDPSCLTKD